jgi:methanogenic corrinoid protein MtbC1
MTHEIDLNATAEKYLNYLLTGRRREAADLVGSVLDKGVDLKRIYLDVFQKTQHKVGRLWMRNEITVAQEHYCTASTQSIMALMYPRLFEGERNGRVAVATCTSGELHELGIRMVADFLELEGWDTYYLGANMPDEDVVSAVSERNADILAVSVTMPYNVNLVEKLIESVRRESGTAGVKIVVGGYPFSIDSELYRSVGADGTARDAEEALAVIDGMVN